jgi:hypothetical protein
MIFQRINFFKGLFMAAEDWTTEQRYHIEKRRLHTRSFFTPGVVSREGDGSLVASVTLAGKIVIQPGYAIDGTGRDLYLDKPEELEPPAEASRLQTEKDFFVFISYHEEKIEKRENHLNREYKDYAFALERPLIGWDEKPPDNVERIELGRVRWQPGRSIRTIDTAHVKHSGPRQTASMADLILDEDTVVPESEGEQTIQIAAFKEDVRSSGLVYLANVRPIEPTEDSASVRWRIESSTDQSRQVRYFLFLQGVRNRNAVKVHVEVFRLKLAT